MAEIKKYLSLDRLAQYDALIKAKIDNDISGVNASISDITSGSTVVKKAEEATSATKATQDASGNVITDTYETKTDAQAKLDEAKGYTDTAEANAKAYADGKDAAIQAAQKAGDDAAAAAGVADGKAVKAQGDVDTLKGYVGTIPADATATNVVAYVQEKTAGIASESAMIELGNRVGVVEGKVATIEGDYLKAADKTELQNAIDAKVAQTDYDTKMGQIDEKTESLQTQINTIMNNPDAEGAINSINEFTKYVEDHGTIADGFRADIDKNKDDIAAEVKRAGEAETALSGRLDTLEAINHDAYIAADEAMKNELDGDIADLAAAIEAAKTDAANKDAVVLAEAQKATQKAAVAAQIKFNELNEKIVQSDWSVNDESDSAYIKGRTHWVEEGSYEVSGTFDGDISSKTYMKELGGANKGYVRLTSDTITNFDNFIDGEIILYDEKNDTDYRYSVDIVKINNDISATDRVVAGTVYGFASSDGDIIIATEGSAGLVTVYAGGRQGMRVPLTGPGIWVWYDNSGTNLVKMEYISSYSFRFADEVAHPLDEKFIPDSIARESDIEALESADNALSGRLDALEAIDHSHSNKTILDSITAENITTWNTVTSKAAQADLTAVGDRVTAIETWRDNFVEISEEEINGMFA